MKENVFDQFLVILKQSLFSDSTNQDFFCEHYEALMQLILKLPGIIMEIFIFL